MTEAPSAEQRKAVSGRVVWSARLGLAFLRSLGATWRIRQHNDAAVRDLYARRTGFIIGLWHNDLLSMVWSQRNRGIVVLVSEHGDGEMVARIIERLGNETVRGSSTRGGSRALIGMIRALERGSPAAITPDGPRGPRHEWQSGILSAARRARVPIVCVGVAVDRAWHFKSWDRFVLPKPFARIHIAFSDPATVDEQSDNADAEAVRFTALMENVASYAAEALSRA